MFALFFNLYLAMFTGSWLSFDYLGIGRIMIENGNMISEFLTSMFNDTTTPVDTLGNVIFGINSVSAVNVPNYLVIVSFVLALITSIGIVVMAVKGVKKAFGIFFMGIR